MKLKNLKFKNFKPFIICPKTNSIINWEIIKTTTRTSNLEFYFEIWTSGLYKPSTSKYKFVELMKANQKLNSRINWEIYKPRTITPNPKTWNPQ